MPSPRHTGTVPRIALTGGVASGKSLVACLFQALGAKLIDTDQIAREIVQPPSPILDRLIERFGTSILTQEGTLDRARLRHIAFTDAGARADLEAMMHPAIRAEVAARTAALGGPYQIVAVPLLVETGTQDQYDRVLLVDCDPQLQLQRLMLRDGLSRIEAERILAAQATRAARIAIADDVILNAGDIAAVASQVEALHLGYLRQTRTLSA
jgi:dephospho-CoA kinase